MGRTEPEKTGPGGEGGPAADVVAESRVRKIASGGHAPTAAALGSWLWACMKDNALGLMDAKDVRANCRSVQQFVSVACHRQDVDELAADMGRKDAEERAAELEKLKREKIKALEAELASLKT